MLPVEFEVDHQESMPQTVRSVGPERWQEHPALSKLRSHRHRKQAAVDFNPYLRGSAVWCESGRIYGPARRAPALHGRGLSRLEGGSNASKKASFTPVTLQRTGCATVSSTFVDLRASPLCGYGATFNFLPNLRTAKAKIQTGRLNMLHYRVHMYTAITAKKKGVKKLFLCRV